MATNPPPPPPDRCIAPSIQQPAPLCEAGNLANNWRDWKKCFDWYLIASGREKASDREKCALFLHVIGKVGRELYEEFDIEKREENNYQVLCDKFESRCDPTKNVNFERHVFFACYQADEDFDRYLSNLKVKSKSCDFGALKDSLIMTQLIRGIKNAQLRESMLRKTDLKLGDAVTWCRAAEAASLQAGVVNAGTGPCANAAGSAGALPADVERVTAGGRPGGTAASAGSAGYAQRGRRRRRGRGGAGVTYDRRICWNCNGVHLRNECPAYNMTCFVCSKVGHMAKCCRSGTSGSVREVYQHEVSNELSDYDDLVVNGVEINSIDAKGWFQIIKVNGVPVSFKLDSGADACIMSKDSYTAAGFDQHALKRSETVLREVSKNILPIAGYFDAKLCYDNKCMVSKVYVLDVPCNNLLSRDLCTQLNLIHRINLNETTNEHYSGLLNKYQTVFEGIGKLPGTHKFVVDETVPPVVTGSRKIPIKLRPKLKEELDRLLRQGIITRVDEPTDWVSSIVLVKKPDGKLRLCIDPRHLNKAIKRSHFHLPTLNEITSNLAGAKFFSHLDASKAFFMIVLHEDSSKLCTFATPFGRFRFLRLPFGICSASEVFHNAMYKTFGMEGVEVFIDDLFVYGKTKEDHDARLEAVLQRAASQGVRFNRDKCVLGATSVRYLGHILNVDGMRPDPERVKAIQQMPEPTSKKELQRFLGMANYPSRFIPHYSNVTEPLRELTKQNIEFQWYKAHSAAIKEIKKSIAEAPTLRYYDPSKPVVVSVDASGRGLGACLLQEGRPVAFAARSLTETESRWAQIEKEMLAIVFGCERFHQFIYGHQHVTVESDHKPLEAIFKKSLCDIPIRLQRMLLRLQRYTLNICYVPGRLMYVADTLSRAPIETGQLYVQQEVELQVNALIENINFSADKLQTIKQETNKNLALSNVRSYYMNGWPHTKSITKSECKPFWSVKEELHVINNIVFRGNRVVIPKSLVPEMLDRIHEGHLGIEKCKQRARDVMWWPGMSTQIGITVRDCDTCAERRAAQPRQPLMPHKQPARPWEVVAADIFQLNNKNYLLIADYFSKYVEIAPLRDMRSSTVISQTKHIFSRHGIPKKFMSDNAMQFMSEEFKQFSKQWEFEHETSSPLYSRSNGLVERNIQTVKNLMYKAERNGSDVYLALLNFRNTAITGEQYSPAQLLMGRRLNTRLPICNKLLDPETPKLALLKKARQEKVERTKRYYDQHTKELRPLKQGEQVRIRQQTMPGGSSSARWVSAQVEGPAPQPRSYWVRTANGALYRRNRQHLLAPAHAPHPTIHNDPVTKPTISDYIDYDDQPTNSIPNNIANSPIAASRSPLRRSPITTNNITTPPARSSPPQSQHYVTRVGRVVRPPIRFGFEFDALSYYKKET